jgi:ketosteroid isomerase-like protein
MHLMRLLLALLVALLVAASLAFASEAEIRAAEASFRAAILARDVNALDALFAPKIVYAHATGKIETKAMYLDRLKEGKQRYDSYTAERNDIVVYGDSAMSHLTVRVTGRNDAGAFNDHVLMLHHWVKEKGKWRLVSHQTAKIP